MQGGNELLRNRYHAYPQAGFQKIITITALFIHFLHLLHQFLGEMQRGIVSSDQQKTCVFSVFVRIVCIERIKYTCVWVIRQDLFRVYQGFVRDP